jgi:hypothetical protein
MGNVRTNESMIEIRWSKETNEIDLEGTPEDLQYVRQSILHLLQTDEAQAVIPAAIDFDSAPYSGRLSSLVIQNSEGSTRVAVVVDYLEVQGNSKHLESFADCSTLKLINLTITAILNTIQTTSGFILIPCPWLFL